MRVRHIIMVLAALLLGILIGQFLWPGRTVGADTGPNAGLDVTQMQQNGNAKNIPADNMQDRTFVFDR